MKSRFRLLIILSFLFSVQEGNAQDIHFSQFRETPMLVNPAAAGLFEGSMRIILNHKSQWASMGNLYKTLGASGDMPLFRGKFRQGYLGAGMQFFRDKAGDSQFGTTAAEFTLSGILPLDEHNKLSVGMQGGIAQRTADVSALQWGSQYSGQSYDPGMASNETNNLSSFIYPDISTGIFYNFSNSDRVSFSQDIFSINAGFSCYHVNMPEQKFIISGVEKLQPRWVAFSSARWDIPDSKFSLIPSFMYMKQTPSRELNTGMLIRYRLRSGTKITGFYTESSVAAGCHYRGGDAIVAQVYYEMSDYALGISYDINTSSYAAASKAKGGLEISLRYTRADGALRK